MYYQDLILSRFVFDFEMWCVTYKYLCGEFKLLSCFAVEHLVCGFMRKF